jgi:DNA-directed RNA polymerase specialized sigma subunit
MQHCKELIADMRHACQPTNADKNNALVPQVAAGDATARQQMICNNMVFVISRVNAYIRLRPEIEYLRDDMTSAGLYGVCKGVNKIAGGSNVTNATAYLSYWINREILLVLDAEFPEGEEQLIVTMDMDQLSRVDDSFDLVDLRELIYSCSETEQEREMLRLREARLECPEIGVVLGVSRRTAFRMLERIEKRFDKKIREQS